MRRTKHRSKFSHDDAMTQFIALLSLQIRTCTLLPPHAIVLLVSVLNLDSDHQQRRNKNKKLLAFMTAWNGSSKCQAVTHRLIVLNDFKGICCVVCVAWVYNSCIVVGLVFATKTGHPSHGLAIRCDWAGKRADRQTSWFIVRCTDFCGLINAISVGQLSRA